MHLIHSRSVNRARELGFTLFELAISMLIITLLATVLLTPITTQVTQSRISQAKTELDQINEALIGFALTQSPPRLPCPDTDNDGIENCPLDVLPNHSTGGNIPWVTLNVPANDPWGQRYQYRVNNAYAQNNTLTGPGFTLNTPAAVAAANTGGAQCTGTGVSGAITGIIKVCGDSACTSALTNVTNNAIPALIFSLGPNGATAPTSPDEIENSDGDCLFVSRTFSGVTGIEFDDLMVWTSPSVLLSRMVTAQKLP